MLLYSNNWRKPPPPPALFFGEVVRLCSIRQSHPGIKIESQDTPQSNAVQLASIQTHKQAIRVEDYATTQASPVNVASIQTHRQAIRVEDYATLRSTVELATIQQNTTAFLLALDAEGSADAFAFSPYEHSPDRFLEVLTPLLEANTQTLQMQPFVANPSLTY